MYFEAEDVTISVLIADDYQLICDMLGSYISKQPGFSVKTVRTYQDTISIIENEGPFDIVLLNTTMPGMLGITSLKLIVKKYPSINFVVFSGIASIAYVEEALSVGAKGYIPKDLPLKSLINTIKLINSGIVFIPANFSTQVIEENMVNIFKLNTVERKVLKKLCTGQSNKEIAQSLNLIENNIKMYMRCLCKKMGAKNRTHIVIIAFQNKMILS